jgi:hypothetical protein
MVFKSLLGGRSTLDIGTARSLERDEKVLDGKVLAFDDFEDGFGRWADHIAGNDTTSTVRNPMSLTSERALSGARSLLMSAKSAPAHITDPAVRANWRHDGTGSYNRLSRDFPITEDGWRYIDISWHMALGGTSARAFGSFNVYLDTQEWVLPGDWQTNPNYKGRSYFNARVSIDPVTGFQRWGIGNQSLSVHQWLESTVGGVAAPGFNEDKRNDTYCRLTLDLWANSKWGRYDSLQVADQLIDLVPFGYRPYAEPPQYSTTDPQRSFAGGLNPGFNITAGDPTVSGYEAGDVWAILDDVVVSIRKAA